MNKKKKNLNVKPKQEKTNGEKKKNESKVTNKNNDKLKKLLNKYETYLIFIGLSLAILVVGSLAIGLKKTILILGAVAVLSISIPIRLASNKISEPLNPRRYPNGAKI